MESRELFKQGQRKCYVCKEIKTLDNFYKRKNLKGAHSWKYACIGCNKHTNKGRFRSKFVKEKGNKCEKCFIYNENDTFFDVDHIDSSIKISKNRSAKASERNNLQVLCPNCHRLKSLENGEIGRKCGLKYYSQNK